MSSVAPARRFVDKEAARPREDIINRCAVCGWPLAEPIEQVRGNCSMRPRPERLYVAGWTAKESK